MVDSEQISKGTEEVFEQAVKKYLETQYGTEEQRLAAEDMISLAITIEQVLKVYRILAPTCSKMRQEAMEKWRELCAEDFERVTKKYSEAQPGTEEQRLAAEDMISLTTTIDRARSVYCILAPTCSRMRQEAIEKWFELCAEDIA